MAVAAEDPHPLRHTDLQMGLPDGDEVLRHLHLHKSVSSPCAMVRASRGSRMRGMREPRVAETLVSASRRFSSCCHASLVRSGNSRPPASARTPATAPTNAAASSILSRAGLSGSRSRPLQTSPVERSYQPMPPRYQPPLTFPGRGT